MNPTQLMFFAGGAPLLALSRSGHHTAGAKGCWAGAWRQFRFHIHGANKGYLVIESSLTALPVVVAKKNDVVTPLTTISQIPTSITTDNYGFVVATSPSGFFVVGPTGALQEDGGGAPFTVNTIQGTQPLKASYDEAMLSAASRPTLAKNARRGGPAKKKSVKKAEVK